MKRALILGGSGFIGTYITKELLENGYKVTVVDNFSKYGYIEHEFYNHPNFELRIKDVREMLPLEFKGYDYVLCLAALIGGIKYFHKIPYQIARDNTQILVHAIDAALGANPHGVFMYFSSSMVYERSQEPVTEWHTFNQLVPFTNYGMQKLFGEYLIKGANEEFGLKYVITRPFNAVGSGELPTVSKDGEVEFGMSHVIPDLVYKALIKQSPFEIIGDGEQIRTFTHAKDIARGVRLIMEKGVFNEDFNLCGKTTLKISELSVKIWEKVNPGINFPGFKFLPAPPSDVKFRVGIYSKAKEVLEWEPEYTFDDIIDDVYRFIKQDFKNLGGKS